MPETYSLAYLDGSSETKGRKFYDIDPRIEPKNDSNLKVEWELNGKPVKPGIIKLLFS